MTNIEIPTIADTCMLAVLSRKRMSTIKQVDEQTNDKVREEFGDESLSLRKGLFKTGPVRELLRLLDRAYDDHKQMTAPYIDRGPRILPGDRFEHYADVMERHKTGFETAAAPVIDQWDSVVAADIQYRIQNAKPGTMPNVHVDEYPTKSQAATMFSMTWTVRPIPKGDDFRTDVPDYVKERLQDELTEAVEVVRRDLIKRMLDPVSAAAEKLKVPIGEKGATFRDSLVGNLRDVLQTARSLNVGEDPKVEQAITELNLIVNGYVGSAESMRTMDQKRKAAANKLDDLTKTLNGLGG